MTIFVDTSAWFARFVPDDPAHSCVKDWFTANTTPLVTTGYCVDETLTLLATRKRPQLALEVGRLLFDEVVARICFLTVDQIRPSWILFQQRADIGWSFTDCTSKFVIGDIAVPAAIALDQHFHHFGVSILP